MAKENYDMTGKPDELYDAVKAAYARRRHKSSISPLILATEAMERINFAPKLHAVGYRGCHLYMRQIARQFCRRYFEPTEIIDRSGDLFPDTLRERYPLPPKPGEEDEYVLLEDLTDEAISYNVERMRRASLALQKHSDALEAYGLNPRRAA
jgi:hypothetical protein